MFTLVTRSNKHLVLGRFVLEFVIRYLYFTNATINPDPKLYERLAHRRKWIDQNRTGEPGCSVFNMHDTALIDRPTSFLTSPRSSRHTFPHNRSTKYVSLFRTQEQATWNHLFLRWDPSRLEWPTTGVLVKMFRYHFWCVSHIFS